MRIYACYFPTKKQFSEKNVLIFPLIFNYSRWLVDKCKQLWSDAFVRSCYDFLFQQKQYIQMQLHIRFVWSANQMPLLSKHQRKLVFSLFMYAV